MHRFRLADHFGLQTSFHACRVDGYGLQQGIQSAHLGNHSADMPLFHPPCAFGQRHCRGFVQHVDGFVGEMAVGQITNTQALDIPQQIFSGLDAVMAAAECSR